MEAALTEVIVVLVAAPIALAVIGGLRSLRR